MNKDVLKRLIRSGMKLRRDPKNDRVKYCGSRYAINIRCWRFYLRNTQLITLLWEDDFIFNVD